MDDFISKTDLINRFKRFDDDCLYKDLVIETVDMMPSLEDKYPKIRLVDINAEIDKLWELYQDVRETSVGPVVITLIRVFDSLKTVQFAKMETGSDK